MNAEIDSLNREYAMNPEWDKATRVHDWRNYISAEVKAMWETFTIDQKVALLRQADGQASQEDWE